MRGRIKLLAAASLLPLCGLSCVHHHHHDEPPPEVAVEPVPQGYVYYYDPYYYQGHYDHDYWYWHDREGRAHREVREEHERRVREHPRSEEREHGR